MSRNYLLIVEGQKTEKNIFESIFKGCDINVFKCEKIDLKYEKENFFAGAYTISKNDKVYLIQGPRNRIHDWLKLMNTEHEDFERFFDGLNEQFAGVFIIYDVDHTSKEDLEAMFNKYNDETDAGLLLPSSPCIEVLADIEHTDELQCESLKTYKSKMNINCDASYKSSAEKFIMENFFDLALFYIRKNTRESGLVNIMEHPEFVVSMINRKNERTIDEQGKKSVYYRYFTTVVYVCVAYILGLVKEFDNANLVIEFFEKNSKAIKQIGDNE